MKTAAIFTLAGAVIMLGALVYAFSTGNFFGEGSLLLSIAWGKVSLLDVYAGFFLFSGWVYYRENHPGKSVAWIIAILVLGNFIACLYASLALFRAKNWNDFWMGKRKIN